MTLQDLKNKIQQLEDSGFPLETLIVRSGHEGGLDEIQEVVPVAIKLGQKTCWWNGQHEEVSSGSGEPHDAIAIHLY